MGAPAINIIVYALAGILVAMGIVRLITVQCRDAVIQEGFQMDSDLKTCPRGTRTFTDRKGNLSCCKGQVNGQTCEGSVFCSFSSNAGPNVPYCSGKTIMRKYRGPIDTFVNMLVDQDSQFLNKLIQTTMPNILNNLRKLPPTQISQSDVKRFETFTKDEQTWLKQTTTELSTGKVILTPEELKQLRKEEVMYIMKQTMDIFKQSPIAKNQAFIQQQLQAQVCKK